MKTREQLDAANRYESYMRGWRDGAVITAMRPEFINRDKDEPLRVAYEMGYGDGRKARGRASSIAQSIYGHRVEVLRIAEERAK